MKTKLTLICIILLGSLFIINKRTPFFTTQNGGWSIGYGKSDTLPPINISKNNNHIININNLQETDPNTVFLADPFFVKEKDSFYIFFEHQLNKSGADISLFTSKNGEDFKYKGIVLDEEFHLSYPNVFKYKNSFYMIPESSQSNNVLLYKSFNFPYDWQIVDTLIKNKKLKDPSIFLSDSLNILLASDDNLTMHMYKSDSLIGNWVKHNKPVTIMGSEARPAGRILQIENNKLIIPIQNCTKGYGYGVSLYEINFHNNYKDYSVKRINNLFLKANPNIKEFNAGMHHIDIQKINDNEYFYVFDGNTINSYNKKFNWIFPMKATFMDLKNLLYQNLK